MELLFGIGLMVLCVVFIIVCVQLRPQHHNKKELRYALLESEKQQQEALFTVQKQMQEQLQMFQDSMMASMKQDLHALSETTTTRLFSIEKQVNENIKEGYTNTSQAFGKVMEQMGKLDESQKNLKELSLSISSIQAVLTDKKTRGIFGEVELYSLLEMAFGLNGKRYEKQYKLRNGMIVDAVIFASSPLHMICIDSKFPLENYNRLVQASDQDSKKRYHAMFVQDVKKHIKTIAEKYIIPSETAEFAYMFLPAEALFSYIYSCCDELIQYSYENKVYIVSPTTLMAYITAIKAIYLGVERNENMLCIQQELRKLAIEFERFEKRYTSLSTDFERSYQDMKSLSITANKLIHRFHEIEQVQLEKEDAKDESIVA